MPITDHGSPRRAVVLWTGGLDSRLAAEVLREQGIDILPLVLDHPYINASAIVETARLAGYEPVRYEFTPRMVKIFEHCTLPADEPTDLEVACRAEMVKTACELLGELGCDFVATGEVLNQRKPEQSLETLQTIQSYVGKAGSLIVRPLSAQCLPETIPEREGWIQRNQCHGIEGPSLALQGTLAKTFGIDPIPPHNEPSCLSSLSFNQRLEDLRAHEGLRGKRALFLLTMGRHFRLGPVTKLVVGQSLGENNYLASQAELYDLVITIEEISGPTGLLPVVATEDQIRMAAAICARFSDVEENGTAPVHIRSTRESRHMEVHPAEAHQVGLWQV